MVVEIVPKPKAKPRRIINFLFYFSLVILVLTITAYFSLHLLKEKKTQEFEDLKSQLAQQETPERKKIRENLREYEEKINDFSPLLDSHKYPLEFFEFLGSHLTHSKVMWTNISLDLSGAKMSLSGRTDSLKTLIQQILIFEGEPKVKGFKLSSFILEEGGKVTFSVEASLSPQLFK